MSRPASLLLVLLLPGAVFGQDPAPTLSLEGETTPPASVTVRGAEELWIDGARAYEAGDYAAAVEAYRELRDRGFDSGALHYNLGNALLRRGELGAAVASYRRALVDSPRDQDAHANLAFARQSTRDAIAPPVPSALARTLAFWHYRLSPREIRWAIVCFNALFWVLVAWRRSRPGSELLPWLQAICLAAVLGFGSSEIYRAVARPALAVVLPPAVEVYSGTGVDTVVRFELHAGTEVRVVGEREDWVRIELPDGAQGWIDRSAVELVGL